MNTKEINYIIADDSCNGEEKQFSEWVKENYPELTVAIENVLHGGLFNNYGERMDEEKYFGRNLWEQYCSK